MEGSNEPQFRKAFEDAIGDKNGGWADPPAVDGDGNYTDELVRGRGSDGMRP